VSGPRPARPPAEPRSQRRLARLVGALVEPCYYWLDLLGSDDHPSNSKVVATVAIMAGLLLCLVIAGGFVARGESPDVEFYGFAAVIIGGAAGWDAAKMRIKTRAAVDVATNAPPAAPGGTA
jgi:hypothetical protein